MQGIRIAGQRALVAGTALAMLWTTVGAVGPSDVRAGVTASTTTLAAPTQDPKPQGYTAQVTATVTPSDATGSVTFYNDASGTRTELGNAPVGVSTATWTIPVDIADGTYHVVAVYGGDGTYAESESALVTLHVGPRPVSVGLLVSGPHDGNGATALKYDSLVVSVTVGDAGSGAGIPNPSGSVDIKVDGATVDTIQGINGNRILYANWAVGASDVRILDRRKAPDTTSPVASVARQMT
ncbi:MAG: Ig-like domain-containing protein [Candidatus Limnocylindrales bacterium]